MTPDEISILVAGLIGGSALLSLLVALLVLTYAEQLRRIFRIRPLAPVSPALPGHYVLPYLQPGPLVEPVGQIHAPTPQRRTTFAATSSDEHLPPRNATPGPSNVPRTPSPAYNPAEAEEYGRFLRSIFRSASPDLPLITIPDSPEAPAPFTPQGYVSGPPPTFAPFPTQTASQTPAPIPPTTEETSQSQNERTTTLSTQTAPTTSGQSSTQSTEPSSDHTDPRPGSSAASTSSSEADTKDQKTESAWATTSQRSEDPAFQDEAAKRPSGPEYTPTDSERNTQPPPVASSWTHAQGPTQNSEPSPTSYWPSHLPREIDQISTAPPDFDNFNQDEETFGGWADEEDDEATTLDYGDYRGYTTAPHFYHQPFPLPDSPTYTAPNYPPPPHPRRVQQYRAPQYNPYLMSGQGPDDPVPGGSAMPTDPPQPSNAERLEAARQQSLANRHEYDILKAQMEAAQAKMMTHDVTWDFAQPPDSKGKEPDRGRPNIPNHRRPLYSRTDRWSVPRPPPKWQAPNPYPALVGTAPDEAPWLGVKPIMVKPPLPFFSKYDDIERFIGDCLTYFEVFGSYFQIPSSRVVFAVTHLEGDAKDWWVHARQDFWANDEDDPVDARFRFPSWIEFTTLLALNFHDPASEEMHEKKMFDLQMGKGSALAYFQELEMEAKKANRQGETDA
ncbi:uncharacterized protein ARMOST_18124 [Armillaria ostoyae]|uniref:Retrotransposon gag domain-containing protein n=1 Tax=Armillaria ostoyae TaxID=47428 RepID=A0A284S0X3_ARMOS|nr:uncharacterized protein ARMOST_18124 [Armillaria ostoyae]